MRDFKKFKLGAKYRDSITKIEGIATAKTEYLTGCARIMLETLHNGEIKEYSFDITRLEGIKIPKKEKKPGGPGDMCPKKSHC